MDPYGTVATVIAPQMASADRVAISILKRQANLSCQRTPTINRISVDRTSKQGPTKLSNQNSRSFCNAKLMFPPAEVRSSNWVARGLSAAPARRA